MESVSYGVGLVFSFLGGFMADKYGSKRVAIFGNLLITLLSFTGLAQNSLEAIGFFLSGWFMRNFRSPARRTMLVQVTDEKERSKLSPPFTPSTSWGDYSRSYILRWRFTFIIPSLRFCPLPQSPS